MDPKTHITEAGIAQERSQLEDSSSLETSQQEQQQQHDHQPYNSHYPTVTDNKDEKNKVVYTGDTPIEKSTLDHGRSTASNETRSGGDIEEGQTEEPPLKRKFWTRFRREIRIGIHLVIWLLFTG